MSKNMGLKVLFISLGLASVIGWSVFQQSDDFNKKDTIILSAIMKYVERVHFSPKDLDDDFSEDVFNLYMDRLDGARRFLTQEDITSLDNFKYKIDDELLENNLTFFEASVEVIESSIERAHAIYEEVIESDFDFESKEYIELDIDKSEFATDNAELKDKWRKYIKYEILTRLEKAIDLQDEQMKSDTFSMENHKSQEELLETARKDTRKMFDKFWERLDKMRVMDWFSSYMNTITNSMDPHSGYFKPKDKADFDMRMSNRLEGIGAQLTMDGNYIKIVSLVPGGPSWKGKELQEDDLVLKVAQEGKDPVDVVGMHIDDVINKIRGDKGTVVILTVKHPDGSIEDVKITRDVIEFDQGYAKSFIVHDSTSNLDIGYIDLPSFYTDFNNTNARKSASDVKNELEKLKEQNVSGVILDLRNNGGGSLRDVVDMAGLFIEKGPIVQVKSRTAKPYVLEDTDESVVYDGPLIILVNHFSASASEIMAAAMQDYGRGVIIGATSTFGKGTVQRFYDLDDALRGGSEYKPLGQVKLTTQKYYRVNGGSVQLKGVIPDIIVPSRYNYIDVGEKDYDFAMEWSKIDPVSEGSWQNVYSYNIPELKSRSEKRVNKNEEFKKIDESALLLKKMKEDSEVPLSLVAYDIYQDEQKELSDKYKFGLNKIPGINISNIPSDLEAIASDSTKIGQNKSAMSGLTKDVYLKEAIDVMQDIIQEGLGAKK